jgi:DNA helicase HerA-like ATPase
MKIPKGGTLYVIKREFDIPFDNSLGAVELDNNIYDIVPGYRNVGLSNIADMVIDLDSRCFDKVYPGKELYYADKLGKQLGIEIDQLILG